VLSAVVPAEFSIRVLAHAAHRQAARLSLLGGRERIKLKTYKDFVSVLIERGQGKHFADSALASWAIP
jgi:hypothetical protein